MSLAGAWHELEEMRQRFPCAFRGQLSLVVGLELAGCVIRRREQSCLLCTRPGEQRAEGWCCHCLTNLPLWAFCSALRAVVCPSVLVGCHCS